MEVKDQVNKLINGSKEESIDPFKTIGYLIRRDIKQSWIDKTQKQYNVPFIACSPEYLHPCVSKRSDIPNSIKDSWEYLSEAVDVMVKHIDECKTFGFGDEEKFDCKVVKITVIEEEVQ